LNIDKYPDKSVINIYGSKENYLGTIKNESGGKIINNKIFNPYTNPKMLYTWVLLMDQETENTKIINTNPSGNITMRLHYISPSEKEKCPFKIPKITALNIVLDAGMGHQGIWKLSEEEIINYTLPFGYHVRDQAIRLIAAGADIPTILADLYPDLPNPTAMLTDLQSDLPVLENWLMKRSIDVCRQTFTGFPFNAGIPIAYLHLLAMEIEDLTVLVEAKSMQIPYDRFRKFLLFDHSSLEPARKPFVPSEIHLL